MKKILLALLLVGSVVATPARAEQSFALGPMFKEAASSLKVPAEWTQAIAYVESRISPWSLNIEGKGYRFDSKEKALQKAREAEAAGLSFDSGVMQVNNFWLKKYGIPLEAAFDPEANIYLGSWILKQEIDRHGQTWGAVGAYHSPNEDRGQHYAEMVKNALGKGPVRKAARSAAVAVSSEQPVIEKRQVVEEQPPTVRRERTDYAPLVVSRRAGAGIVRTDQQQVNAVPFVQRLNSNKI